MLQLFLTEINEVKSNLSLDKVEGSTGLAEEGRDIEVGMGLEADMECTGMNLSFSLP